MSDLQSYDGLEVPADLFLDNPWAGIPLGDELDFDPALDFDLFPILDDVDMLLEQPIFTPDGGMLDDGWGWHDARLIGVERETEAGTQYEVGVLDLYANLESGDLGGSYLPIGSFTDMDVAEAFYHDMQHQVHQQGLTAYEIPDFAKQQAMAMNPEPENWRGASAAEYAIYEQLHGLETLAPEMADDPPFEAIDPLIQTAIELGGVIEREVDESAFQALNAIGVQVPDFDPDADPPPFYDADTGTAYWIGVFQPDKDDRESCVTSILSLGRDPDTGEMQAQLAPCVPGDWNSAYKAAEHLIQVAEKGRMEQVFETAESMALAAGQRELWETERGVSLESDTAHDIADYARDTWEMEL